METYKDIPIEHFLQEGDCLLYYEVVVRHGWKTIHCLCPLDKCRNIYEAIDYYFEVFHKPYYVILLATTHHFSNKQLQQLTLCC